MKKIFLLLGIAAFSSASAQQKDLFNIQKYLQKKQEESKKLEENKKFVVKIKPVRKQITWAGDVRQLPSYNLLNGNKVIILSLDHMPCIIPDMKQFMMPNIPNRNEDFQSRLPGRNMPGTIPNPTRPFKKM